MIVYDLQCEHGHRFEGWFGSSADFDGQQARGLVSCPQCGSVVTSRAPMAPAVGRKGNQVVERPRAKAPSHGPVSSAGVPAPAVTRGPMPAEVAQALDVLARAQAKALTQSTWVGKAFAEQSREMHYGERDVTPIHGQASLEEARNLLDEGIAVVPLPFPVSPPDKLN
ncbi:hypothetical protein PK98_05650 [Croceibacterium mercuriale]|uniref:Uncharacterized protein n=1 Tax=Croceibacterium mercuriale TaxID=1572751 RepID=A0A0B2C1Y9_9SPHN|nr:DUF1178 family protein [Croceibacterium mercuriale]KHL26036.1 hypothetical protein PK98_05650 [Croceibacterium mercuriale]